MRSVVVLGKKRSYRRGELSVVTWHCTTSMGRVHGRILLTFPKAISPYSERKSAENLRIVKLTIAKVLIY